jgi:DNA invertase Pin-like site-specific DNA recombinase
MKAWAAREGAAVVSVHADTDVSGSKGLDKRPALLAAIAALPVGGILLVAKRDRLARGDVMLMAMIESAVKRKKGRIVSAAGEGTDDDDPGSILMRRMIDAFAEYERLIIGCRTKAALAVKKRRGERVGCNIPYGSRLAPDGVMLEPDPAEQRMVEEAKSLHATGLYSLRQIGKVLAGAGFKPRTGSPIWHPQLVKSLLGLAG